MKFLVDNIESEWAYEGNPFDFIHARNLFVSIRDFGRLVKQCYRYAIRAFSMFSFLFLTKNRSVKPGGWVEFQDLDGYPHSEDGSLNGTGLQRYYDEVYGAFEKAGYEVSPGPKLEQWFKDAGFVNIRVEKFVVPYGVWPKDEHLVSLFLVSKQESNNNPVLTSSSRRKSALGTRLRPKRTASRPEPWPL